MTDREQAYTVTLKAASPQYTRLLGKQDGLSREYIWSPENGHTQELSGRDAEKLQQSPAGAEFSYRKARS